ncbi:MAG: hypothetical protein ACR2ND_01635 [Solirubrobacteraceae bacterium]
MSDRYDQPTTEQNMQKQSTSTWAWVAVAAIAAVAVIVVAFIIVNGKSNPTPTATQTPAAVTSATTTSATTSPNQGRPKVKTITKTNTVVAPAPAPQPSASPPGMSSCDQNISVNSATTCPFADNVFAAYAQDVQQTGGPESVVVYAYSSATGQTYTDACNYSSSTQVVLCSHGSDLVQFPEWAAQAYNG